MDRTEWDDLPEGARTAVQAHTGPVTHAKTASEGLNSALAAFLHTPSGTVFVKGLHRDHRQVVSQQREAMIAPYVVAVSPRLLWQVEVDGWHLLGFEYVGGRHADYRPGSADVPKVIDAMRLLGQMPCPDLPLKRAEQRWSSYVDNAAALEVLAGDALLHTDWNPLNVLISDGTARIIDWAWPTRGAGFVDPGCLIVRLMAAGHTAREAEDWAGQVPAWNAASVMAIDTFVSASSRMWAEIVDADPVPWKKDMAEAAQEWAEYRSAGRSGVVRK
jgi:hypothetical protein